VALSLAVACALWGGFAASVLWGWFVVPLGVPEVSMLHAVGLMLALRALAGFSGKPQPDKPEDKMVALRVLGRVLAVAIVTPGLALAVGWVVRGAM
jgi:hypothetical protein